jgi:hypothetical protein
VTREEAIARLRECPACRRWITTMDCDHCFVDRLPPRPAEAIAALHRAVLLGREAEQLRAQLRSLLA